MECDLPVSRPLVSVIMNCLNCAKYLREAIDSVYSQSYPNWEIVFWDNASTDESGAIAQSYDERLRYFRGDTTIPLGAARNEAMKRARGDFLGFLDCDDLWMAEKLEKQIPLFEKDPRIGIVICDTIFFNDEGYQKQLFAKRRPPTGRVFRELLSSYFISMETAVIRRQSLESLDHWFDDRFNMIEEADLFLRIAHSWDLGCVNEPLAKWRVHSGSWTWAKKELFPKEKQLMLKKYELMFDNWKEDYKREIANMERDIQYRYALIAWEKGENDNARKLLLPYLGSARKHLLVYLMTFFPYSLFVRIKKGLKHPVA